jgi:hypothetical protein
MNIFDGPTIGHFLSSLWRPHNNLSEGWVLLYLIIAFAAGVWKARKYRNLLTSTGQILVIVDCLVDMAAFVLWIIGSINLLEMVLLGFTADLLPLFGCRREERKDDAYLAEWEKDNTGVNKPQAAINNQDAVAESDEESTDIEAVRHRFETHSGSTP